MSLIAVITSWSIPQGETWKLRISVRVNPLGVTESFYRVHDYEERTQTRLGKDEWHWRCWSAAAKPTVRCSTDAEHVLDVLVRQHPDLSRILHLFGYEATP